MRTQLLQAYYELEEYKRRLKDRIEIFQRCEQEPLLITQLAVDRWALNPIEFIEQFAWIINPKFNNEVKPLFLFDYQKKIIQRIWEAEQSGIEHEFLVDKPREMGLTWIFVWYYIWRWSFTQNWSGFVLSRTEVEVDDGTSDPSRSIFGKMRWSLAHLPEWMLPQGFVAKGKKGNPTDMTLRLMNPQMNSSITGSTANQNAARGSRFSMSWTDECFFIEHFMSVSRSLRDTTNLRVYVSTSKTSRQFEKFRDACAAAGNYISLKWQDNPFKDQEWANERLKAAEYDPEAIKELEVGYGIPSSAQYYPEIVNSKVETVVYNRKLPLYVSLDYGRQDHTVLIWWQYEGGLFKVLECIAKNKVDFDWFTPYMNRELQYNPERYLGYYGDMIARARSWERPRAVFGEPAHKQIHYPSNTSIQKELFKYGVKLSINDNATAHEVRRKAGSLILGRTVFNKDLTGAMDLYDAIMNSRYAGSVKGTSKDSIMKPAHDDEVGDYRSAFENFAVNVPKILRPRVDDDWTIVGEEERDFTKRIINMLKI